LFRQYFLIAGYTALLKINTMPTYSTQQLIDNLEKQTKLFLSKAIAEWQLTPSATLLQKPARNKWSAAQCLEHLNNYGHYYLPEIDKAIEAAKRKGLEANDQFKTGLLGNYFTQLMLPKKSGKLKKMSAPKEHKPIADLDARR
jgi:hypothetical protein